MAWDDGEKNNPWRSDKDKGPVDLDAVVMALDHAERKAGVEQHVGIVRKVGVDSLMTQLARCCKPAPPDAIQGFVTRGKGVSIHRADCSNFRQMKQRSEDRVIDVEWGRSAASETVYYPVDVAVEAIDRQGLLRDISEVFAKEKMNVIGVQTQSIKGLAWMTFTIEVSDSARLAKVLTVVKEVKGVRTARRR